MNKERPDERVINKMPDKKTLQEYINGLHRRSKVVFNLEKGEFEWNPPKENDK